MTTGVRVTIETTKYASMYANDKTRQINRTRGELRVHIGRIIAHKIRMLEEGISSKRSLRVTLLAYQRAAISEAYLDLFKVCNGLLNVPSVVLETVHSKLNIEVCERAYLRYE